MFGSFDGVFWRRMFRVKVAKSKILHFKKICSHSVLSVCMEKNCVINECKYLGVMISQDSSKKAEVESEVKQNKRIGGAPRALMNDKN